MAAGVAVHESAHRGGFSPRVGLSVAQRRSAQTAEAGDQGGQFLEIETSQAQDDGTFRIGISLHADAHKKWAKTSLQVQENVLDGARVGAAHGVFGVHYIQPPQHPKVAAVALGQGPAGACPSCQINSAAGRDGSFATNTSRSA